MFALPHLNVLNATQARSYRERLAPLNYIFKGRPFQYGHLIEMPVAAARHLTVAASIIERMIVEQIRERGVTAWLADHAPHFGNEILNYSQINRQLETRIIEDQFLLPIAYDGLIVLEHGRPQFRVIEIQSGIAAGVFHQEVIRAAGRDPDQWGTWYGPENPLDVLRRMKKELAYGEEITIIDTDPSIGMDQTLMARILGNPKSHPISALDIESDAEIGYFAYRYLLDPMTKKPLKDPQTGRFLKTEEKKPIKHVLSRLVQPDLDQLDHLVGEDQVKRILLERFFQDARLNWLQHPSWQHIIDKSTLPFIWRRLEANQSPIQADLVPVYGFGNRIPPGTYVYKPTSATNGEAQEVRMVPQRAIVFGDNGYLYQKLLQPYPFPILLTSELADTFPMPRDLPASWREDILFVGWKEQVTAGTVEIRAMSMPWGRGDHSMYFLVRLAPRYSERGSRIFTQTNSVKIRQALDHYLPQELHPFTPFGWCPVVVRDERNL